MYGGDEFSLALDLADERIDLDLGEVIIIGDPADTFDRMHDPPPPARYRITAWCETDDEQQMIVDLLHQYGVRCEAHLG